MSNQYLGDDRIVHESIDVSKASSRRIYSNSEAPDDIVTRLRVNDCFEFPSCDDIKQEAADEIERLREQLDNASAMANSYYELVQAYKWSHNHLGEWPDAIANLVAENYNLRKAVRGEKH